MLVLKETRMDGLSEGDERSLQRGPEDVARLSRLSLAPNQCTYCKTRILEKRKLLDRGWASFLSAPSKPMVTWNLGASLPVPWETAG